MQIACLDRKACAGRVERSEPAGASHISPPTATKTDAQNSKCASLKRIDIALVADQYMEAGLHVAIASALNNLPVSTKASIHLFLKGYGAAQVKSLERTCSRYASFHSINIYPVENGSFAKARGLHFSLMPFQVLRVPLEAQVNKVLYLDCDVVVLKDITTLFELEMPRPIGAVSQGSVAHCWSKERDFLTSTGVSADNRYYNTGVLLIDCERWRIFGLHDECSNFIRLYGSRLVTADQSVVNGALQSFVFPLDAVWNATCNPLHAPDQLMVSTASIIHFVGSPKPWDIFADHLHSGAVFYRNFYAMIDFSNKKKKRMMQDYIRALKLSRSYWKLFVARFFRSKL